MRATRTVVQIHAEQTLFVGGQFGILSRGVSIHNFKLSRRTTKTGAFVLFFSIFVACFPVRAENDPVFAGITEPIKDVTLSASLLGVIRERLVKEGDFVKEGQLLIQLDQQSEELEVQRHKLQADLLRVDLERLRTLIKNTTVPKAELDRKEAEYNIAVVEHHMAEQILRKRQILAPIAGIITELPLQVGEACQPNQAIVRLVDTRQCYFVANIEPRSAARLKIGLVAKVEIETSAETTTFEGKIAFISPVLDPASGLLKVKIIFDNPADKVRPGIAGKMRLTSAHGS